MNRKKPSKFFKSVIDIQQLEASPEFRACNAKQQQWLRELIANGFNFTDATVAAFACNSRRNALIRSYAIRKSPFVRAALALLVGKSESDLVHENQRARIARLLREVNRHLRAASPGGVAAQRLLSQKDGLIRALAAEEIKNLQPTSQTSAAPDVRPPAPQISDPRIPADAIKVWLGDRGEVVGYRNASGVDVRL